MNPTGAGVRRRGPRRWREVAAAFVPMLAAVIVAAAEPSPVAGKFFGGLQVEVVNVETFVTDAGGAPVLGLGPDDFELYVDGKSVPITNFYTVDREAAAKAAASDATAAAPLPEAQRLYVVAYVDNTSLRASDRNQILDRLQTVVDHDLGSEDRLMVVTNGPRQQVRLGFDEPRERLSGVLEEIMSESGGGGLQRASERQILAELRRLSTRAPASATGRTFAPMMRDTRVLEAEDLLNRIRAYAKWRFDATRADIEQMRGLVVSLSGLPGRKAMLYVGQGVSLRVGQPLFDAWVEKFAAMWSSLPNASPELRSLSAAAEASHYSVRRYFDALASEANMSRVTLYAIDASQSSGFGALNAERAGFEGGAQIHAMEVFGQQESLQLLAGTTGGRHLTNLENVDGVMRALAADFRSYYSLGFTPDETADGAYHSISVTVKREGVRVRSRRGFRTKSLDEAMSDRLMAALFLDVAPNPLDVTLVPGTPEPAGGGRFRVPLLVKVPVDRILLVPQADEQQGRLTIWVATADGRGRSSEVHGRRVPVRIPNGELAAALDEYVGYTVDLVLGDHPRKVALNVRDELALVNSTVTADLDPESSAAGSPNRPPT